MKEADFKSTGKSRFRLGAKMNNQTAQRAAKRGTFFAVDRAGQRFMCTPTSYRGSFELWCQRLDQNGEPVWGSPRQNPALVHVDLHDAAVFGDTFLDGLKPLLALHSRSQTQFGAQHG